jgi:hypothetical protein
MQMMIWFLVYLLLILALARWRDHHDAARTKKHRRDHAARGRGLSRRRQMVLRSVRGMLPHSHRTS